MNIDTTTLYALAGAAFIGIGLYGLFTRSHLILKIIAINIMSAGIFMMLIAQAARATPPDPVPHAMVLTGIVVAVAATALALTLTLRVRAVTGRAELPGKDAPPS